MVSLNTRDQLLHITVSNLLIILFSHTVTTYISTLSLHDALPIFAMSARGQGSIVRSVEINDPKIGAPPVGEHVDGTEDRKSTRLNSSHRCISYAVFCLKKKNLRLTYI